MFTLIQPNKYKAILSFTVYILVFSYLLTIFGCETTKSVKESPEYIELFKNDKVKVTQIVFKDGTFINATDKQLYFFPDYHEQKNIIMYPLYDTIKTIENGKVSVNIERKELLYKLDDVKEVYITKTGIEAGSTVILVIAVLGIALLGVITVVGGSFSKIDHNSCPYVYSFDGNNYVYDAEPLSGAVCEGLSRTDCSRLDYLKPDSGKFKLLVRNENKEQQHIDEMKLVTVNHDENKTVTCGQDNNFYQYRKIDKPLSVTDENGKDVTLFFEEKDNFKWQTNLPAYETKYEYKGNHKIHLRFKKPAKCNSAMLFLNGGIAEWGSKMVKNFISLYGNKINDFYGSIYHGSIGQKQLHTLLSKEQLYYLDINVLENGEYVKRAVYKGAGPLMDEDILINIPLESIKEEFVDIMINPAPGFWKFDKIGLVGEFDKISDVDISTLDASFAADKGTDIRAALKDSDKFCHYMPESTSSFVMKFDVPDSYKEKTTAVFLTTTGWYEISTDKSKEPRTGLFDKFLSNPGSIIEYSMKMYSEEYKIMVGNLSTKK